MNQIVKILMERDGMSQEDAQQLFNDAKEVLDQLLANGDTDAAYDICEEYFGLEPDYLQELIGF